MLPTKNNLAAIRPLMFAPIERIVSDDHDVFERRIPDADAVHGREVCLAPVRADGEEDTRWTPAMWVSIYVLVAIVVILLTRVR